MDSNDIRIECDGFLLRPFAPEDAESLARMANNQRIWDNVRDYFPHPYTRVNAESYIAMASVQNPPCELAIVVDGAAVGSIGYVPGRDVERVSGEIGYWLGEPYWGRGIAGRAVEAITAHIFATTGILRLFAAVFAFNTASARVLEKAGYRRVGTLNRAAVKNGQVIDLLYYEKTKDHTSR